MAPFQVLRTCFLSLFCLSVLAVTASSQTPPVSSTPLKDPFSVMPTQRVSGPSVVVPESSHAAPVVGNSKLFCAGYIRYARFPKTPEIVGAEQEQEKRSFAAGDFVYLNAGSQQGIKEDQHFEIVRPRGDLKGVYRQKKGFLGTYVQELGQLQVLKVMERTSLAQISFSCGMVLLGDLITPIPERVSPLQRPETTLDRFENSSGKKTGRLMMAETTHEMLTRNDIVYIDLGAEDKVSTGDYLTIYRPLGTGNLTQIDNEEAYHGRATGFESNRRKGGGFSIASQRAKDSTGFVLADGRYRYKPITTKEIKGHRPPMPRKIVGEMVILDVQARTATAVITRAVMEVHTGDWVEVR
jgi:hypothetical protein